MKLTKPIRSAIIFSAMKDVPKINYEDEIQKIIRMDVIDHFGKDEPYVHYVVTRETVRYGVERTCVQGPQGEVILSPLVLSEVERNLQLAGEQFIRLRELESKIYAAVYSVTTRKELVEILPEFEKYIPADAAALRRALPGMANLVSDFVKARYPVQVVPPPYRAQRPRRYGIKL